MSRKIGDGNTVIYRQRAGDIRPDATVRTPTMHQHHLGSISELLIVKSHAIFIVESASTDGSREIVREYEGRPRVTVIWQDTPRGKGNAVRAGLQCASGDFVLIQDADDEYDIEDYDALVAPLMTGEASFMRPRSQIRVGSMRSPSW